MGKTNTVENIIRGALREAVGAGAASTAPAAAIKEATQVVLNQTNNEKWFQSRVTLGVGGGLLVSLGRIIAEFGSENPDLLAVTPDFVVIMGALLALYGRWKAKKPLGA